MLSWAGPIDSILFRLSLTLNPTNPKLQARIPADPYFTICPKLHLQSSGSIIFLASFDLHVNTEWKFT